VAETVFKAVAWTVADTEVVDSVAWKRLLLRLRQQNLAIYQL
jgi:hypothetical protein